MEDQAIKAGVILLLKKTHTIRQRENIRFRINLLRARGLTDTQIVNTLKANPPTVELVTDHL